MRRVFAADVQRWILVGQLVKRRGELVEVGLARRLDCHRERGRREVDGVVQDDGVLVAERRVRRGRGELRNGADVAGADRVGDLLLLSPKEKDLTDALGLLLCRVEDLRVVMKRSRVDAHVAQLPHERVGQGLEHKCRELVRRIGLPRDLFA